MIGPGTCVAGRWTVGAPLPAEREILRWEAGQDEVVAPRAHALLRPGAMERFAGLVLPEHPAILPVLARDEIDGVPVRVRPRIAGTLAEIEVDPARARELAGWLAPAVVLAGAALGDELRPEDVAIGLDGVPRLAPAGVPLPEQALAGTRPYRGADALHGLGVMLGVDLSGELPPPPAEPPVLTIRPPPALPALPARSPIPKYVVLTSLATLDEASLRRVAVRSGSDFAAVRDAARRGVRWAVAGSEIEAEAVRMQKRLVSLGIPAGVHVLQPPKVVQYLILAAVCGVLALVSGFPVPFVVLGAILVWMGLVNFRAMWPVAEARMAWQERTRALAAPDTATFRLYQLRARLAAPDVPEVVAADLRGQIAEIEGRLDAREDPEAVRADVDAVEHTLARVLTE